MCTDEALAFAAVSLCELWARRNVHSLDAAKRETTRWFAVHALVNAMITLATLPALPSARSPSTTADPTVYPPSSWAGWRVPICACVWLHVHHVLLYRMTRADVWHHCVFVPCIAIPGCIFRWGAAGNLLLFSLCGLPGGLIYGLLWWQRCGYAPSVSEPTVSGICNGVVRPIGALVASYCLLSAYASGRVLAPDWAVAFQLMLGPINGLYYGQQALRRWSSRAVTGASPHDHPSQHHHAE